MLFYSNLLICEGKELRHKEVNIVRVAVWCWPMNKTEITNNKTVIVYVNQTKGEIIDTKLTDTIKTIITNYITSSIVSSYIHLVSLLSSIFWLREKFSQPLCHLNRKHSTLFYTKWMVIPDRRLGHMEAFDMSNLVN